MIHRWSPEAVAAPIGPYSHLVRVPADHELVVVSGQIGILPDGELAGPDAESQTRALLGNLERLLEASGAGPEHLVKVFSMVSGTEHLPGFRTAMREAFTRWYPAADWPAQSLIVVAALAKPELVVEVEALIAIPKAA